MSGLPSNIDRFLYQGGDWKLPGEDGEECVGAAYHSPRPLFVQHTMLVKREWWPEDSDQAYWVWAPKAALCGTCRDNLDILLQMLHATNGDLEWPVRREFGNALRALAHQGWTWFAERRPEVSSG
jgi:hypothetical protein